jgi:hypothetical protein
LDVIAIVLFILQHAFPFRTHLIYRFSDSRDYSYYSEKSEKYQKKVVETEFHCIFQSLSAFVDTMFFVPGGIFTLIMPTLWGCTWKGLVSTFTPKPISEDQWNDAYSTSRWILISRVFYAPYDLIAMPMGFLALISPFRHIPFRTAMAEAGFEYCGVGLHEEPLHEAMTYTTEVRVLGAVGEESGPSAPAVPMGAYGTPQQSNQLVVADVEQGQGVLLEGEPAGLHVGSPFEEVHRLEREWSQSMENDSEKQMAKIDPQVADLMQMLTVRREIAELALERASGNFLPSPPSPIDLYIVM